MRGIITWWYIATSAISEVRTVTCTAKGSRCVCTWSKWTVAVVGTAGALVNIYKKGIIKVSVIITCITVFFAKRKQVKTELRRNPSGNWIILFFNIILQYRILLTYFKGYICNYFLSVTHVTPKKISYESQRKYMSNFTKRHLTHEIFRILPVFSQLLWNLTFYFVGFPWEIVFGVISDN